MSVNKCVFIYTYGRSRLRTFATGWKHRWNTPKCSKRWQRLPKDVRIRGTRPRSDDRLLVSASSSRQLRPDEWCCRCWERHSPNRLRALVSTARPGQLCVPCADRLAAPVNVQGGGGGGGAGRQKAECSSKNNCTLSRQSDFTAIRSGCDPLQQLTQNDRMAGHPRIEANCSNHDLTLS